MTYTLELWGPVPPHKNEKMPIRSRQGKLRLITKPQIKAAMERLAVQIPAELRDLHLEHPDLDVTFWVEKRSGDRDNMLAAILDLLWTYGVIIDDNIAHFNGTMTIRPAILCDISKTEVILKT